MRHISSTFISLGTIASFLLASLPAFSQDYARRGFYLGAGAVGGSYSKLEDELEDGLLALGYVVNIDVDEAVGFNIYAGYRVNPNFAAEVEFEMLPETDISASGVGTFVEIETWALTSNMKAFFLTGRVQPYALLGIGSMKATLKDSVGLGVSETVSGFTLRFGGGLDVYITESVAAFAGVDYLLPTGDVEDLDYVSFGGGVQYRF